MSDGIKRCAICGGEPVFHARFTNSFAKCTVCGNGFEIFKSDFEYPRSSRDARRDELLRMWNAKQDANEIFMESNDWVRGPVFDSPDLPDEGARISAELREFKGDLERFMDEFTARVGRMVGGSVRDSVAEVLADLNAREEAEPPADPGQRCLDDFPPAPAEEDTAEPAEEVTLAREDIPEQTPTVTKEEVDALFEEAPAPEVNAPQHPVGEATGKEIENYKFEGPTDVNDDKAEQNPIFDEHKMIEAVEKADEIVSELGSAEEKKEEPAKEPKTANPLAGMSLDDIQFYLKDLLSKQ